MTNVEKLEYEFAILKIYSLSHKWKNKSICIGPPTSTTIQQILTLRILLLTGQEDQWTGLHVKGLRSTKIL